MDWLFPVFVEDLTRAWPAGRPPTSKYGVFGYKRSYYYHQGIDIYTRGRVPVHAVESGLVVAIVDFTGPEDQSTWLYTQAVLVEGSSGVVCYGEVTPEVEVGDGITRGDVVASVAPVLETARPDIPGHSRHMLHLEWYKRGTRDPVEWLHSDPYPENLLDPTSLLVTAYDDALRYFELWNDSR